MPHTHEASIHLATLDWVQSAILTVQYTIYFEKAFAINPRSSFILGCLHILKGCTPPPEVCLTSPGAKVGLVYIFVTPHAARDFSACLFWPAFDPILEFGLLVSSSLGEVRR